MYNNVGKKIMTVAYVLCVIEITACVLIGIILMLLKLIWPGILVAAVGSFLSWKSSLFLQGFGLLVKNSDILVKQALTIQKDVRNLNDKIHEIPAHTDTEQAIPANES